MQEEYAELLQRELTDENRRKLMALENPNLHRFVADAIGLCKPESVLVCTDSAKEIAQYRQLAIDNGEEISLATEGHTFHFDGTKDEAGDNRPVGCSRHPALAQGSPRPQCDQERLAADRPARPRRCRIRIRADHGHQRRRDARLASRGLRRMTRS